ncbi:MlaD family protein [Hymenobacter persicinus]|uniref:MCE family protein n=1 Tax=Hymenobacter persicinus TaxID=2025506 RepID=A0A4Q5LAZ7_9BACT|nr:MlaD family protein [Hymenobacter persicinus]RYU76040.1 MCE family protein [Hymenobacter persicinus]
MPQRSASNHARLGLFVLVGVGCLLAVLFLLGRQQNLFSRSLPVRADFRNVAGLLPGNNVRLGGITVGTVKKIRILNDSTVRVEMSLNRDVQPFVRQNAVASVGTDGLVGNTIVNLSPGRGAARAVQAGDLLPTRAPVGLDAMLGTLDISNHNLVGITQDLRQITGKLNGSTALWQLLDDQQLAGNVHRSLGNIEQTTQQLGAASHDLRQLTQGVRRGRGPLGYLLTDEAFAAQLGHAARQLATTSDTLASTLTGLQRQAQSGAGPVQALLTDTAASGQLRRSMRNVEQATGRFNQSMAALQQNFLLRGYFRRQQKKQARAAAARELSRR